MAECQEGCLDSTNGDIEAPKAGMRQEGCLDSTDGDIEAPKASIDRSKFREVQFRVMLGTKKSATKQISTESITPTKQNKSPSPGNSPIITTGKCCPMSKLQSPPSADSPIFIEPEKCELVDIHEGYNATSTEAILRAVEIDGKHTLSLSGRSPEPRSKDTWFREYSHVQMKDGIPDNTSIYFYECYTYPGYYVRWTASNTVDCEPKTDVPHQLYYQWKKEPVEGMGSGYSLLIANNEDQAYLTFETLDAEPTIQPILAHATKFLIHYR